MLQNRMVYLHQLPVLLLIFIIIAVISGCGGSTKLTKKQQEVLEENLDFVADAIHFSATKIQQPLADFYGKHGAWPVSVEEQIIVLKSINHILIEHGVASARLISIDKHDVLVEYNFDRQHSLQFPSLLESWSIVYTSKNGKQLEVVSVYPSWSDPEKLAKELHYDVQLVKNLQTVFKQQLHRVLSNYSLTLNENLNDSI